MTRDEFESAALTRLQHLYPQARFLKAGQLEIAIVRTPSGRPTAHRLRLARAWAAFCQNGDRFDLDSYLTRVVGTIERRVPPDWESARPLIYPKLLTASLIRRHQHPLFYPLADEVGYVLACDDYDVWLTREQLQRWEIEEECVLAAAMGNLQRLWEDATVVAWTVRDVIRAFHIEVSHAHKAELILVPEFLERATELLDTSEVLVALPNRNFLVAFGAGDGDFHEILRPILRKELVEGYPLNRWLIRLNEDGYAIQIEDETDETEDEPDTESGE